MGKNALRRGIEKLIRRTPEVRLSSGQIRGEVMKMKPGDKKTFNFDPDDPKLCDYAAVEIFVAELGAVTKCILSGSLYVDEKKGKYLYTVAVVALVWK